MKGAGEDYVFNLYLAYMIPTWGGVMILNFYEGRRLMAYLRKNHHEYWIYLTSGMGFGPGIANSFRSLPFLFSDDDLNDPNVKQLKENYRQFVLMLFLVFFSIPIFFVIIMLPY
jgi:hypothetical protein